MAWQRCRVCTKMQLDPVEKSSCEVPFVAETTVLYLRDADNYVGLYLTPGVRKP